MADSWCTKFSLLEKSCDKHTVIIEVVTEILSNHLSRSNSLSKGYEAQLERIITAAYDWNVLVHSRGVGHYFRPFCPPVGSPYDPVTSDLYHVVQENMQDGSVVAVVASIGLETWFLTAAVGSMHFVVNGERRARVLT